MGVALRTPTAHICKNRYASALYRRGVRHFRRTPPDHAGLRQLVQWLSTYVNVSIRHFTCCLESMLWTTTFLHLGTWRLGRKDLGLGCGAGWAVFLYRHGPDLAGQCRNGARFVASGAFGDSNTGSSKPGGPVLDNFFENIQNHTRQRRERLGMILIASSLEIPAARG